MQLLSRQVGGYLQNSSWIRRMFEAGIELKKKHGADQVYDFSLGNPDLPAPAKVRHALHLLAEAADQPFTFGYMPNAGHPDVRAALAAFLAREQSVALRDEQVMLTCGAAGGLNVFFRAVLEAGDEVVCPAPYFVEYGFYVENYGGVLRPARSRPLTFELDLDAIERAITPKTRAVLINSPNNPTGEVYPRAEILALARILEKHSRGRTRPIFLVSDEPYRFLAYDGIEIPPVLPVYRYSIVIGSFSKSLSLAGARIGYIALNPEIPEVETLMSGLILANRILGFVNAPAIGQHLLRHALGSGVEVSVYDRRRHAMARVLTEAGYVFSMPKGAFYFFPQIPVGEDDTAFVKLLLDERVLAVPGCGFGYPGYFRLAFCTHQTVIEKAADGFRRAAVKARGG